MKKNIFIVSAISMLFSCRTLKTTNVSYQSVRTRHVQPTSENPIPADAKIAVAYTISRSGRLTAIVYNRTPEILTIDQTKSFFVNSDGMSISYYDPTVRVTSTTDMSSVTKGTSVNLGSIANAFGVGGIIGTLANGINVGGSGMKGMAITDAEYVSDSPQVSIAPYGNGVMSKIYHIDGIGGEDYTQRGANASNLSENQSYCKFSVCITYSFDGGNTYDKLITNFYANSQITIPVTKKGHVNEALRELYAQKPDAVNEKWWIISFDTSHRSTQMFNSYGVLYDYN